MKKLLQSFVTLCLITSVLFSTMVVVNAKPLEGEIEMQVTYEVETWIGPQMQTAKITIPKEFANLNLIPNKVEVGYKLYELEDEIIDGVTYKWVQMFSDSTPGNKFVLLKDEGNPFYEPDETKRIDYSERYCPSTKGTVSTGLNVYNHFNKDASKIKVYIDGVTRSFKTAFYPERVLLNHAFNVQNYDARIPMVSIREFVDSVDYMSLVWDNGRIIVSNSKTGKETVFSIYDNKVDLKAVLLDGTSYASLDDLLIAQFSYDVFKLYCVTTSKESSDLGYYVKEGTLADTFGNIYEAFSNVGAMSPYILERYLPGGY